MEKSPCVGSAEFVSRAAIASVNTPLFASWLKIFLNLKIFCSLKMRPTEKTPRKLKFAIDVKARDICTRPGDVNAAEVDLLGEGLVLKLDGDRITEEAGRDSDREGKSV